MARCSSCNAPIPAGTVICEYCGCRNDIDLKGINYYTTHESLEPRICPRCNEKLKTIDLKINGKFLIEKCDKCFGLFFDNGELEALLDKSVTTAHEVDQKRLSEINRVTVGIDYPISYLKCPVCSDVMSRVNYGAKSGVIVDKCKAHGVWLDAGELTRLFEWMRLGGKILEERRQDERKIENERRIREERDKMARIDDKYDNSFSVFGDFESKNSGGDLLSTVTKLAKLIFYN